MTTLVIDAPKMRRLEMISAMTAAYLSIMDDMATECCVMLQVPNDHSDEADLARSIVDHSASVTEVVAKLAVMKAQGPGPKHIAELLAKSTLVDSL